MLPNTRLPITIDPHQHVLQSKLRSEMRCARRCCVLKDISDVENWHCRPPSITKSFLYWRRSPAPSENFARFLISARRASSFGTMKGALFDRETNSSFCRSFTVVRDEVEEFLVACPVISDLRLLGTGGRRATQHRQLELLYTKPWVPLTAPESSEGPHRSDALKWSDGLSTAPG